MGAGATEAKQGSRGPQARGVRSFKGGAAHAYGEDSPAPPFPEVSEVGPVGFHQAHNLSGASGLSSALQAASALHRNEAPSGTDVTALGPGRLLGAAAAPTAAQLSRSLAAISPALLSLQGSHPPGALRFAQNVPAGPGLSADGSTPDASFPHITGDRLRFSAASGSAASESALLPGSSLLALRYCSAAPRIVRSALRLLLVVAAVGGSAGTASSTTRQPPSLHPRSPTRFGQKCLFWRLQVLLVPHVRRARRSRALPIFQVMDGVSSSIMRPPSSPRLQTRGHMAPLRHRQVLNARASSPRSCRPSSSMACCQLRKRFDIWISGGIWTLIARRLRRRC